MTKFLSWLLCLTLWGCSCSYKSKIVNRDNTKVTSSDIIPDSLIYNAINFLIANKDANPDLLSKYLIDKQKMPFIFYFKEDSIELRKLDTLFTSKDIDFIFSQKKLFNDFKIDSSKIVGKIILLDDSIESKNSPIVSYSSISFPLFNLNKTIFIVRTYYQCSVLCGTGGTYIYKKINSKWTLIKIINQWIS